jgi:hypothetical protein
MRPGGGARQDPFTITLPVRVLSTTVARNEPFWRSSQEVCKFMPTDTANGPTGWCTAFAEANK